MGIRQSLTIMYQLYRSWTITTHFRNTCFNEDATEAMAERDQRFEMTLLNSACSEIMRQAGGTDWFSFCSKCFQEIIGFGYERFLILRKDQVRVVLMNENSCLRTLLW